MAEISIIKVNTVEALEALQSDWNRLLSQSDVKNVFLTFEWIKSWWEVFGNRAELYTLIGRDGDALIGIAPLMRLSQSGFVGKKYTLRFIGSSNADYADFISPDKSRFIPAVFDYLHQNRKDWDTIDLIQIPDSSSSIAILETALKQAGAAYNLDQIESCLTYRYQGDAESQSEFALKINRTMRKHINYFEKSGGLTLERLQDTDDIRGHLDGFFVSHINRWNQTSTPSKFLQTDYRWFYDTLVTNLTPHKYLSFMLLKHGDRPLAYFFTYHYEKTVYLYTVSFDLFYLKKAPGNILINLMTTRLIRDGYNVIDHTRGAESYKENFTNVSSTNCRLTIYKHSRDLALARLKTRIRRSEPIQKLAQNQSIGDLKTKLYAYRTHHGTGYLFKTIFKKLLTILFEYKIMLVFNHNHKPLPPLKLPPEVTIEQMSQEDFDKIASFVGIDRSSRKHGVVMKRFANGGECFVARYNGIIASIAWGLFKEDYLLEIDKHFPLTENQVDLGDDFTSPVFRGRGIHPLLIAHRVNRYRDKKLQMVTTILKDNIASIKGYQKNGFVVKSKIRYLKILGIRIL